jgi:hypothetical protein
VGRTGRKKYSELTAPSSLRNLSALNLINSVISASLSYGQMECRDETQPDLHSDGIWFESRRKTELLIFLIINYVPLPPSQSLYTSHPSLSNLPLCTDREETYPVSWLCSETWHVTELGRRLNNLRAELWLESVNVSHSSTWARSLAWPTSAKNPCQSWARDRRTEWAKHSVIAGQTSTQEVYLCDRQPFSFHVNIKWVVRKAKMHTGQDGEI